MPGKHTELAFESAIEHHLVAAGGFESGDPDPVSYTHLTLPTN